MFYRSMIIMLYLTLTFSHVSATGFKSKTRPGDNRPLCTCAGRNTNSDERLIGYAAPGSFPYASVVVLRNNMTYLCGATLITNKHVLTASHSIRTEQYYTNRAAEGRKKKKKKTTEKKERYFITKRYRSEDLLVGVGHFKIDDIPKRIQENQYLKVSAIIDYYPEFDLMRSNKEDDITILELAQPVTFNETVKAVWLAPEGLNISQNSEATAFGWGMLNNTATADNDNNSSDSTKVPTSLISAEMDIWKCDDNYEANNDRKICAIEEIEDNGTCKETYYVKENKIASEGLVGKTKKGVDLFLGIFAGCGNENQDYRVFTKVGFFENWIYSNTRDSTCRPCIAKLRTNKPIRIKALSRPVIGTTKIKTIRNKNDKRPLCACAGISDKKYVDERIITGKEAVKRRFPYASAIIRKKWRINICGAVLITDRHVLTATHCARPGWNSNYTDIVVSVGDYDIGTIRKRLEKNEFHNVSSVIEFPDYVDLAIVELDKPVKLKNSLKAVWLPPPDMKISNGSSATVYGWGEGNDYVYVKKRILRTVDLPIVPSDHCQKLIRHGYDVHSNVCAGGRPGRSTCVGELGGGLVAKTKNGIDLLLGILFDGGLCAEKGEFRVPRYAYTSVFARVSKYVDWIYENTKTSACRPCIARFQTDKKIRVKNFSKYFSKEHV